MLIIKMDSIKRNFNSENVLKVAFVALIVYIAISFYRKTQTESLENTATPEFLQGVSTRVPPTAPIAPGASETSAEVGSAPADNTTVSAADLLPKYDEANEFAKQNPVAKLLQEQNFVTAGYHAGINTVVQSNKIPYLDLRSAPAIPKRQVGPFMNSSYEEPAGAKRRQFEII